MFSMLLLFGCSIYAPPTPLTNDEIIREIEKCNKANLNFYQIQDSSTMRTTGIVCTGQSKT
jgi:hypothetical protein